MTPTAQHISITGKGANRTVWLRGDYVIGVCGVDEEYLRVKARPKYTLSLPENQRTSTLLPDSGKSWRYRRHDGAFWYDLNRIPERKPTCYKSKLLDEVDYIRIAGNRHLKGKALEAHLGKKLVDMVDRAIDKDDSYYFREDCGVTLGITLEKAEQMARSLAWLRVITRLYYHGGHIHLGIDRAKDVLRLATPILKQEHNEGLRVSHVDVLRRYLKGFGALSDLYTRRQFVISKKYNNDNARKVYETELVDLETGELITCNLYETIMYSLMMNPYEGKQRKTRLYKNKFLPLLSEHGLQEVSESTFNRYTGAFANKMKNSLERHGYKEFNSRYMPYVANGQLKYSNSLWVLDGSGSKLGYLDQGKIKTLYINYVFDARSRMIVGYSVEQPRQVHGKMVESESFEGILKALQMAFKYNGYTMPRQMVTDNFSAFSSNKSLFKLMCDIYTPIEAGNSQANYAETMIRIVVNEFRDQINLLNTSFNAKDLEHRANPEFVKANKDRFPDRTGAELQIATLVERHNNTLGPDGLTPMDRYHNYPNPDCKTLSVLDKRRLFGYKTRQELGRQRSYIICQKDYKDYQFTIPDYFEMVDKINKMTGFKSTMDVDICFDHQKADLYTLCGKYIMSCSRTDLGHRSIAEATDESIVAHKEMTQNKLQFLKQTEARSQKILHDAQSLSAINLDTSDYNIKIADDTKVKEDYNTEQQDVFNEQINSTVIKSKKDVQRQATESF